jgi:tetratricopeptide (TPR) repeat protein
MSARALLAVFLLAAAAHAESFKSWAARASREEREKNGKDAFQSYSNALSTWKPSDGKLPRAKIFCARGALRDKDGDEAGALADYTECLAADKTNAKIFDRRGQLRLKSGKTALSIDDFYKAVAIDIRFGWAYAHRAQAYEVQGDAEFAGEDYRRACDLGVKAACPKAKALASARKGKSKKKSADEAEAPAAPAAPEPEAENAAGLGPVEKAPPETPAPPRTAAPAPAKAKQRRVAAYSPRFGDCLNTLQACADAGAAFGACVGKAPPCEQNAVKGCCPGACLQDYRKALNRGVSEAEAFRDIFSPEANCAAPPKPDED